MWEGEFLDYFPEAGNAEMSYESFNKYGKMCTHGWLLK